MDSPHRQETDRYVGCWGSACSRLSGSEVDSVVVRADMESAGDPSGRALTLGVVPGTGHSGWVRGFFYGITRADL